MNPNPIYAGAYSVGRTMTRTTVVDGQPYKTRGHRRAPEEWIALHRHHHEPYIPWERYEQHQQLIAHNAQMKGLMVRGAVRRGSSLLAGLLRCGHCGRRLHVGYSGTRGQVPRYYCRGAHLNHGTAPCISVGGLRIDAAIDRELVRVLAPGAIEAALAAADRAADDTATARRAIELELREARYEAERAQRQYDAVEPEHRLVAETLETRWNATLQRVRALEQRLATVEAVAPSRPDRATLLQLAEDFPKAWHAPTTDIRTKKRIVRLLLEEIVVTAIAGSRPQVGLLLHWKGGTHTQLIIPRNRTGQHGRSTDRAVVDVVQALARSLPDAQIARVLNRLGYRTGTDNTWTQQRVASLRQHHQIPVFDRAVDRLALLTIAEAAAALGVSTGTIRRMLKAGLLRGTQPVPHAPWAIQAADLALEPVQRAAAAVKRGGTLPRTAATTQLTLDKSYT